MDQQVELTLDVKLVSSANDKNYTILEAFLTNELYNILPELDNNNLNWTDIKNRLGNSIISKQCPTYKKRYIVSLCLNGLFIGGFTIFKLYNRLKK